MNSSSRQRRLTAAALTALAVAVSATACSSGSGSTDTKGAGSGTYTIWDPYPQFDDRSDWVKLLTKCGTEAGVTVKRTGYRHHRPDQQGAAGGAAGQLARRADRRQPGGVDAGRGGRADHDRRHASSTPRRWSPTCSPPASQGGKTYGMPIGANTLALYYNKKVLDGRRGRHRLGQGLGVADRGAGEGQGGRQEGHHLLGDRHRGGQLPVPALVLGLRRQPDRARLRPGRRRAVACGPTG